MSNEPLPAIASLNSRIEIIESFYNAIRHDVEHVESGIEKCFERIEKLDKENEMRRYSVACVDHAYDATCEGLDQRIKIIEDLFSGKSFKPIHNAMELYIGMFNKRLDELEKWKQAAIEKNIQDNQRIKELERYQEITHLEYKATSKKPHKCPICDGSGKKYIDPNAPLSGYEAMFAPKDEQKRSYHPCQPCETKGIVWG